MEFSEVRRRWSSRRGCKLVQSRGHGDGPPEVALVLELVESELGHLLSRDAPSFRDAVDPQDVLAFGGLVGEEAEELQCAERARLEKRRDEEEAHTRGAEDSARRLRFD